MTELKDRFAHLGLSQYLDSFVAEGFDTWDIVLDISESDLTALNVKLGHRRKLQRAIAEWRGDASNAPLPGNRQRASLDGPHCSDESGNEARPSRTRNAVGHSAPQSTKRKYRRHPKPDEHAPERPPSAYVIFSNQVRETLKGQDFSFADIAKIVGERWQVLSPSSREACDKQAATAKEKYYHELSEYKQTPQYTQYQAYLIEFKAKHSTSTAGREEGKRSKLETESSVSSTQSNSGLDRLDRSSSRRSRGMPDYADHHMPTSVDQHDQMPLRAGFAPINKVPSAIRGRTGVGSPRAPDALSPTATSPASSTTFRDTSSLPHANAHDLRASPPGLGRDRPACPSTATSPPPPYQSSYEPTYEYRHPRRDAPGLLRADSSVPSLVQTETNTSSISQSSRQGSVNGNLSLPPLTLIDPLKSHRILPQPSPAANSPLGPVDPAESGLPTRFASPTVANGDGRVGLSALLIASEMVGEDPRNLHSSDDRPP